MLPLDELGSGGSREEFDSPYGRNLYHSSDEEGRQDDLKVLKEIKRNNKKRLEMQRSTYMQVLDYIRDKSRQSKAYRVTECERRILDALKIITEANWVINSGQEMRTVLNQIGVEYDLLFS